MRIARGTALAAACLFYGSSWLVVQGWPSELPPPFASFIHFALMACVGFGVSVVVPRPYDKIRTLPTAGPMGTLIYSGVAGACFFAVPVAVVDFSAGAVAQSTLVQVFCAIPVLTVLVASHLGLSAGISSKSPVPLTPSLTGLFGAVLLLGISSPGSLRRWLFVWLLIGCSVLMALTAVWLHALLQRVKLSQALGIIGFASAVATAAYGKTRGWPALTPALVAHEILRGFAFDLPLACLTVWLMREMDPVRLSARFLLAPFLYAVEYLALMRSVPSLQAVAGLTLMCTGGVLLVRDEPEQLPGLRLR